MTDVTRLSLVSRAAAPCVWTLTAPTRNLRTYLLTYWLTCFTKTTARKKNKKVLVTDQ